MFITYPALSTHNNWVHESIYSAMKTICHHIDAGTPVPTWPNIVPHAHRTSLQRKRKIRDLLASFSTEAQSLSAVQRAEFLAVLDNQNDVSGLLDGSVPVQNYSPEISDLMGIAKDVFDEGFALLSKTGLRDSQYQIIYDALDGKTCPFCGCEPFEAPGMSREDEDHYLPRSKYPLAAANLSNLAPMGGKCNERYKGDTDVIFKDGVRRKALNPYGDDSADVCLNSSDPLGPDNQPVWQIDLVPDIEETRTWDDVFSIRSRLLENVLKPYYESWLGELPDWFEVKEVDASISDGTLFEVLEKFVAYKKKHKETGHGFLKDKVFEMLLHHCRSGNSVLISMIRSSLPQEAVA